MATGLLALVLHLYTACAALTTMAGAGAGVVGKATARRVRRAAVPVAQGQGQAVHGHTTESLEVLVAPPLEAGAQIGNGYVGAFVPKSVPGSAGAPVKGIEHVAGVFSGPHEHGTAGGTQRVTRASLRAYTATAYIGAIDGHLFDDIVTQSALDLRRAAYILQYSHAKVQCQQRTYAHRSLKHLVVTEFHCTNQGKAHVIGLGSWRRHEA